MARVRVSHVYPKTVISLVRLVGAYCTLKRPSVAVSSFVVAKSGWVTEGLLAHITDICLVFCVD